MAATVQPKSEIAQGQLIAVIRIRGSKETRTGVEATLSSHLHMSRKFHCFALPFNATVKGWLQFAKDYITFAPISMQVLEELIAKRGRTEGDKPVQPGEVKKLAGEMAAGVKTSLKPFRLAPPLGGFRKSTKLAFPRGELGKRDQESMEKLLRAMI